MESDCCAHAEPPPPSPPAARRRLALLRTYYPLLLILAYLLFTLAVTQPRGLPIAYGPAMAHFMGGFFLVFSFFKLLDLRGFADAYQTYDLLARRMRVYAYAYPLIELALAGGYLSGAAPRLVNLVTLTVMALGSLGVIQALRKKQAIQCACLGTVFNLPMTEVTLFEDLLMAGMALGALLTA